MNPQELVRFDALSAAPQTVSLAVPQPSRLSNAQVGALGEDMAALTLQDQGYEVLDRNWRDPGATRGELDLVCLDGRILVTVEVKTRRLLTYGHPSLAVNERKLDQLRRLTAAYLSRTRMHPQEIRIDVISILLEPFDERELAPHGTIHVGAREFDHFTAVA